MSFILAIKQLLRAKYFYILEDPKALDTAKDAIKLLRNLLDRAGSAASTKKQLLQFALETYDLIKSGAKLSSYEQINFITSKIGDMLLLPFPDIELPHVDLWETEPWTDPEFPPQPGWLRVASIEEIQQRNPKLVMMQPNEKIQQANQSHDCSLICSMISLNERRPKDLTRVLHPRTPSSERQCTTTTVPKYTPSGHYVFRLLIGGVWRMVEIDDYVPWTAQKTLRTKHGSLLPILLEKAYLKILGGYDFEGSNAALDMNRIAGGLPYYLGVRDVDVQIPAVYGMDFFDRLYEMFHTDQALICIGTGSNAPLYLQRNHDFVVLDLSKDRKLKVLNPWHEVPVVYDWADVQQSFNILYLTLSPQLYPYESGQFNEILPTRATYNVQGSIYKLPQFLVDNPQDFKIEVIFSVSVKPTSTDLSVSLLIRAFLAESRLLTDDEAHCIVGTPETDVQCLSLVVPIPPKTKVVIAAIVKDLITDRGSIALHFQLRAKHAPVLFKKLPKSPGVSTHRGDWPTTAGIFGSTLYFLNPQFVFTLKSPSKTVDFLLRAQDEPCQLAVFVYDPRTGYEPAIDDLIMNSGPYASGFRSVRLHNVQPGTYMVIPSQYEAKRNHFLLVARCDSLNYTFERKPGATAGQVTTSFSGSRLNSETTFSEICLKVPRPATKVIAYISENCTLDCPREMTISRSQIIRIHWKHGTKFNLDLYSPDGVSISDT